MLVEIEPRRARPHYADGQKIAQSIFNGKMTARLRASIWYQSRTTDVSTL